MFFYRKERASKMFRHSHRRTNTTPVNTSSTVARTQPIKQCVSLKIVRHFLFSKFESHQVPQALLLIIFFFFFWDFRKTAPEQSTYYII